MEQRKIMSLGRSSLVISLPKDWLESNRLERGDLVSVDVQRDSSLVILPGIRKESEPKRATLYIDPEDKEDSISRRLIAYYLNGYSLIEIFSKKIFSVRQLKAIRRIAGILYMSIMESDAKKVSIQTLIDESKAEPTSAIQRMHMISVSMCQDSFIALKNRDETLTKAVISLDDDVDQFSFLILRLLRSAALDPTLAKRLGLEPINCLDYQTVVHRIEYVADNAANISKCAIGLIEKEGNISENLLVVLLKAGIEAIDLYNTAVYAFFSKDTSKSDEIIEQQKNIEMMDQEIASLAFSTEKNPTTICAICSIRDSIKRITECAANIAETTLDATVASENRSV